MCFALGYGVSVSAADLVSPPQEIREPLPTLSLETGVKNTPNKISFWKGRSKKKLKWGWALALLGGAAYIYGSKKETRTETGLVNVQPALTGLSLDSISSFSSVNFGNQTVSESLLGTILNSDSTTYYNVTVLATYTSDNLGTVLASDSAVVDVPSGGSANWSTDVNYSWAGSSSETITLRIASAQTMGTITKSEARNKTLATLGIGTAAVGGILLISYALGKTAPQLAKSPWEIRPDLAYNAGEVYQGVRLLRPF